MKCFQITFSGDIKGRGLRFSTLYIAFPLHVTGFVQYSLDRDIIIEAEGEDEHLDQFIAQLRNFVKTWRISPISVVETSPKGYLSFDIRTSMTEDVDSARKSLVIKYKGLLFRKIRRMFGPGKYPVTQSKSTY